MSEKSFDQLNGLLYRGRIPLAALALVFVLYCVVYLWFYIPHGGPNVLWRPDSQLIVWQIPDHMPTTFLEPGDLIMAIDGQQPQRMRLTYPPPLRPEYEMTVWRNGELLTDTVTVYAPLSGNAIGFLLPATFTGLLSWLVGAIILFFATPRNREALHSGSIFLLAAAVLIGIQASIEGVPGAWMAGHVLIFFLAIAWVYLGMLPRLTPLDHRAKRLFLAMLGLASVLAFVAIYEVIVLFPHATSMQEEVGISLYSLGFFLAAIGLLACVGILAWRVWHLPSDSYLRQQLVILLFFFSLGILPTMLLTVIPRALIDQVLLPFPVAISLMVLIPAGYLFVIHRRGFLGLDIFFGRILYFLVLALGVFGFYASGFYLVQRWLQLGGVEALVPATVVFFPTLMFVVYINQPVNQYVQRLIYGPRLLDQEYLTEFTLNLSTRPEEETLFAIMGSVASLLNAPQAVLTLKNEQGQLVPVAAVGNDSVPVMDLTCLGDVKRPIVRTAEQSTQPQRLFESITWAEIVVPVLIRDELIGLLVLSRPGQDGYYNAQQVLFLMQVAGILAVTSQNLYLFESTRRLSRKLLAAQEKERKEISRRLHDEPLQRLTYVITLIDQILARPPDVHLYQVQDNLSNGVAQLRTIAGMMREICEGLRSPLVELGVDMAVQEIVSQFTREHEGLALYADIQKGERHVSEEIAVTTCYVLTESLNNVVKHAPDAEVYVSLKWCHEELVLEIADTGPGSQLAGMTMIDLIQRQHLGIAGMYEWARLIGGQLILNSNYPSGMCVRLRCPFANSLNLDEGEKSTWPDKEMAN